MGITGIGLFSRTEFREVTFCGLVLDTFPEFNAHIPELDNADDFPELALTVDAEPAAAAKVSDLLFDITSGDFVAVVDTSFAKRTRLFAFEDFKSPFDPIS
jgi:hypothetical protein